MDASRKVNDRLTSFGSTSLPDSSFAARFQSGCCFSSARFSSDSLFSFTVSASTSTDTAIISDTMINSG